MNINLLKKGGIITVTVFASVYLLFLTLPLILTPVLQGYIPKIKEEVNKSTGLDLKLEGLKIVSTPKFTIGIKVKKLGINYSNKKEFFATDNFQVKMSLLSLLTKKIRVDLIEAENLNTILCLDKDGSFEIEKYLPKQEENNQTPEKTEPFVMPFGLKLSNHLPNIKIKNYNISFINLSNSQKYQVSGNKIEISDFIFNKKVKLCIDGKVKLLDREQFVYNLKINNRIMPEVNLHEFIFNPEEKDKEDKKQSSQINILNIFNGLYNNNITANLSTDIKTSKNNSQILLNGYTKLDNLSVAINGSCLPASNIDLIFKGHKINVDSNFYTAKNENSTLKGVISTNKNNDFDLNFKSQAELSNLIKIVNSIATTFNIQDLKTITANGKIDADFNVKSSSKKIKSNGFLKIPSAKMYYGLYNIGLNDINADISLNNNNINIKNIGFSILNQPLRLYGTIKEDTTADLKLTSGELNLKGLLIALGQSALLKENTITSGIISLNSNITGRLNSIKPSLGINLDNLNVKNIPANTILKLNKTVVDINSDGKTFSGKTIAENLKIINPAITISAPKIEAFVDENSIEIKNTPVSADKINLVLSGTIKNYLKEVLSVNFATTGDINSTLTGDINMAKQNMNLNFSAPKQNQIIIPMFNKSKMIFNGNTSISGSLTNPHLNGSFDVKNISIPEIPVVIDNMLVKLNGTVLTGNATVSKFSSGGIVAQNLATDFSLKGNNFYLNNLKGKAFDGNINGNIIYNMANANTGIVFNGSGLNAKDAVAGSTGIKNALTGTLSFDTKLTMVAKEYNDMMKSMKGNFNFKIDNGAFGTIGRLESFLSAGNIVANSILKTTVSTLSTLSGIKNTAKFDYIQGTINFANGWANLISIKSTGSTLAYYITGKYNLLNGTTNVVILGRLDAAVVALLGPLGDLSASKLLNYIPKFGTATANIVEALTSNPKAENISAIPKLSNNGNGYKDFKVVFNGGIESQSSVKSFKWLTTVDTSAIQPINVVDTIKSLKTSTKTDVSNTVNSVKDSINTLKSQQEALKNSAEELKNLFKF